MMNITYHVEDDTIYICLDGRIDSSNAKEAEQEIDAIKNQNSGKTIVLDAEKLQYISSAGLRIILHLRKEVSDLSIVNVASEVYEVFDMTGFTEMMTIEKAFRRLSVDGCEFIAKGATGAVYRYDEETVVKVYFEPDALPEIYHEREMAKKALVMGVNTAIPYGIVRIGDGYGTVTELLNADPITKMIIDDPENLDEPVKYFVDMLKVIHSTELNPGDLPDVGATALGWVDFVKDHLPIEQIEKLRKLILDLPQRNTMLHGDFHTGNIMIQNGEAILIDLDTLAMGHPVFEFGPMFNAFIGFSEIDPKSSEDFFGYSFEIACEFWKKTLIAYLGTEDPHKLQQVEEKSMIIGYVRMLRRAIRYERPDNAQRIERCREQLTRLLAKVDSLDF